jgi:hypothetical protein
MVRKSGGLYRVYGEGRDPSGNSMVVCQVLLGRHMFCQECGRWMDEGELLAEAQKRVVIERNSRFVEAVSRSARNGLAKKIFMLV